MNDGLPINTSLLSITSDCGGKLTGLLGILEVCHQPHEVFERNLDAPLAVYG